MMRLLLFLMMSLLLTACQQLYINSITPKQAEISQAQDAENSKHYFWHSFHAGQYENISKIEERLTAAYLNHPHDSELAAYLAFTHAWAISERTRLKTIPATITNHSIIAAYYYQDALTMRPDDPILKGFLADFELINATNNDDKRLSAEAYFKLKDAIAAWPEFNYFTGGYLFSRLPKTNPYFQEGLQWQWQTIDLCYKDRNNPDFAPYMHLTTIQGPKRACWNSSIAPHNVEGFFLNMGDMLVKNGDLKQAKIIYQYAKQAPSYSSWPYKKILETRLRDIQDNEKNFNLPVANNEIPTHATIMLNSRFACMACHQN